MAPAAPLPATEVAFYHLTKWPLDKALPRLLEQAYGKGIRVVVKAASKERLEAMNSALWTYDPASFLPHGAAADGMAERQPIYLTTGPENPNGANIIVLIDNAQCDELDGFDRCLEVFDGTDETALAGARDHWRDYKAAGHSVTYWRQSDAGKWERQE